jgi:hypothetical protein
VTRVAAVLATIHKQMALIISSASAAMYVFVRLTNVTNSRPTRIPELLIREKVPATRDRSIRWVSAIHRGKRLPTGERIAAAEATNSTPKLRLKLLFWNKKQESPKPATAKPI